MQETNSRKLSKTKKILLWVTLSCLFLYVGGSLLLLMSVVGPPDWVIRRMGGKNLMYLRNPGPGDPTKFDANGNPVYDK
jgi:hypothetical protein